LIAFGAYFLRFALGGSKPLFGFEALGIWGSVCFFTFLSGKLSA
jgi:hypothetical protein